MTDITRDEVEAVAQRLEGAIEHGSLYNNAKNAVLDAITALRALSEALAAVKSADDDLNENLVEVSLAMNDRFTGQKTMRQIERKVYEQFITDVRQAIKPTTKETP